MFSTTNDRIEELPVPMKALTEAETSAVKGGLGAGPAVTAANITSKGLGALAGAFMAGFAIGTYLDGQFGWSNKIGDWLAS